MRIKHETDITRSGVSIAALAHRWPSLCTTRWQFCSSFPAIWSGMNCPDRHTIHEEDRRHAGLPDGTSHS
jgi:hypothetical protein